MDNCSRAFKPRGWKYSFESDISGLGAISDADEELDSLSLKSGIGDLLRPPPRLPRMLPKEGRTCRGLMTTSQSSSLANSTGDFFLPAPSQLIRGLSLPPSGESGVYSSGEVGGLAARLTTSASSSKLTLTDFFLLSTRDPSSEATEVPSDSSFDGTARPVAPSLPSGDKDVPLGCFKADLTGDTDLGGGW